MKKYGVILGSFFIILSTVEADAQKVILKANEHLDYFYPKTDTTGDPGFKHDKVSFSIALQTKKGNHNEIGIHDLGFKDGFKIGGSFQHKWVWFKMSPLNPYIGLYTSADYAAFQPHRIEDTDPNRTLSLETGVAPGLQLSIGPLFVDADVRLALLNNEISWHTDKSISERSMSTLDFKDQLSVRVGAGIKF